MSELTAPPVPGSVRSAADLLDRVANGVLFLAVLTGAGTIFGGLYAIFSSDRDIEGSHPYLAAGLAWAVGGGLLCLTIALLAVWAKAYAAVVKQSTAD